MTKSGEWVCVGAIAGAHGVKGDVKVRSFTQSPEDCFAYGPLFNETGVLVLEPKTVRSAKNVFVVGHDHATNREAWEARKGEKLYVPREVLPEPEDDEFYYDDLLGLIVTHMDGRALGKVKAIQNFGADDLLEIVAPDKRTAYYLPFSKEVVPTIRLAEKELIANPDEAYLPEDMQIVAPDEDGNL